MAKSGFMFGKAALLTFLYPSAENTFNITMEAQVAPVRYIKTSSVKSRRCRAWILVVTFFFSNITKLCSEQMVRHEVCSFFLSSYVLKATIF